MNPTSKYDCPVCGYPDLPDPPLDMSYEICPSCGTEFGYTDFAMADEARARIHHALRIRWLRNGARWHGTAWMPPPANWNPRKQVLEHIFPTRQVAAAVEGGDIVPAPRPTTTILQFHMRKNTAA